MPSDSAVAYGYTWSWRIHVGVAACLLIIAIILVRWVRLSRWRWSLGKIVAQSGCAVQPTSDPTAAMLAASMERAALRLPFASKCLARAVALQWRLRLGGMPADLVIAFHKFDHSSQNKFHAWVEQCGTMVIGHCDRGAYQPVLTFSQGRSSPAAVRT